MIATEDKIEFLLTSGKKAHVEASDGDKTTISSPDPSPPGSIVRGNIQGVACAIQLKVRNCRKKGELFFIDGRLQNATRELKTRLNAPSN